MNVARIFRITIFKDSFYKVKHSAMTLEEATAQAQSEVADIVKARATEIFNGQITELESALAALRSEVDSKQAELDSLKAQIAESTETPAEETSETSEQEQAEG